MLLGAEGAVGMEVFYARVLQGAWAQWVRLRGSRAVGPGREEVLAHEPARKPPELLDAPRAPAFSGGRGVQVPSECILDDIWKFGHR